MLDKICDYFEFARGHAYEGVLERMVRFTFNGLIILPYIGFGIAVIVMLAMGEHQLEILVKEAIHVR